MAIGSFRVWSQAWNEPIETQSTHSAARAGVTRTRTRTEPRLNYGTSQRGRRHDKHENTRMPQPRGFEEGGARRRIQTKGQKTEFVRIAFAVRDRQNGMECASGAMKGRYQDKRKGRHKKMVMDPSLRVGSRSSRAVVMEDHGCGFECECEGAKAERSGALNEREYRTVATKSGGRISKEEDWQDGMGKTSGRTI
ncbi:hypothetical protein B0H13DRAFT_1888688 [Mycena leptocephala]|nr:hypothetical protein B0H13DRAFT_1888688 [Mycena leptocephala]